MSPPPAALQGFLLAGSRTWRPQGSWAPGTTRLKVQVAGMRSAIPALDDGTMLRCLIVDDSPRFLDAARNLLELEGIAVVGVASSGAEAIDRMKELRPDVTLLDIDLGGESGFELARRIDRQASLGACAVILLSTHAEADYVDLIEASPALGFLSKSALSGRAIRELLRGGGDGERGDALTQPGA
ncbi:MAG: putative transcriptional regulator [Frankiales bacterium]|nr:putative transcriptional regulator [Frankiales bacterium]